MNNILAAIIAELPRYAEEGSYASSVKPQALLASLLDKFTATQSQSIVTTLHWVENILSSLAVLEPDELARGEWKFVSHPAQLCALSVLHTLADPQQKLFPVGFWQTAGVGDAEKQQQKQVLQALEQRRQAGHLQHKALPIRFVYVAWAIIKLDNKILFHQREATEHPNEYGLIGGRANANDLKHIIGQDAKTKDLLATLQTAPSQPMLDALEFTLHRECAEEAKLIYTGGHYTISTWRDLKPWQDCMGAAPNYALTQYVFRLYHLQLSTTGYLALKRRLDSARDRFIWCDYDEIMAGQTKDGAQKLRIDAVYGDFAADRMALRQALEGLTPSYINSYNFSKDKDSLMFSANQPILRGETGKEQLLPMAFTTDQSSLLLGIAAHAKGLQLKLTDDSAITLHSYGWIELHTRELQLLAGQLSELFRTYDLPYLELVELRYVRLSMPNTLIFFAPTFFSCNLLQQDKHNWQLRLQRQAIPTAVGEVTATFKVIPLKGNVPIQIHKIAAGTRVWAEDKNAENLPRQIRSALQDHYQGLGLKVLLVTREQHYALACRCE